MEGNRQGVMWEGRETGSGARKAVRDPEIRKARIHRKMYGRVKSKGVNVEREKHGDEIHGREADI